MGSVLFCDSCGLPDGTGFGLVECDGCVGDYHRDCGRYMLIIRHGQEYAYFFCGDCEEG